MKLLDVFLPFFDPCPTPADPHPIDRKWPQTALQPTTPSRAELGRAKPGRAQPSRFEPKSAKPSRDEPRRRRPTRDVVQKPKFLQWIMHFCTPFTKHQFLQWVGPLCYRNLSFYNDFDHPLNKHSTKYKSNLFYNEFYTCCKNTQKQPFLRWHLHLLYTITHIFQKHPFLQWLMHSFSKTTVFTSTYKLRGWEPFWDLFGTGWGQWRSKAEPSRAGPGRAKPSRAEPSRAGPRRKKGELFSPTRAKR